MDNMAKSKRAPHWWLIDSYNVGRCKYCGEVRDFGRLLRREGVFAVAGQRGAKARKEVLSKKGKQSAAMKELWQNPEYRVKQSAAAKKRWQDPEYRAKQRVTHAYQHKERR